jgi:hypothetical protein
LKEHVLRVPSHVRPDLYQLLPQRRQRPLPNILGRRYLTCRSNVDPPVTAECDTVYVLCKLTLTRGRLWCRLLLVNCV